MNKRILTAAIIALSALLLAGCSGAKDEGEETTLKSDWRNTIEYESSFFVNESTKLLYALDTGSITLWDNGGKGEVLQVVEYDTTVADAIERIEKEDFNGDGNCDIRIIYSEGEKGSRYTLFLWNTKAKKYSECQLYGEITDPEFDESGKNIVGVEDLGAFGKVTRTYAFNDTLGLDEISVVITDPEGVAKTVAEAVGGGELRPAQGKATIEGEECTVYVLSFNGRDHAFIAYNRNSKWYVDKDCLGFYRTLLEKDGDIVAGDYVDTPGVAQELAEKIYGEGAYVVSFVNGILDDQSAVSYKIRYADEKEFSLAKDERGYWYYSEDDASYKRINATSGEIVGEDTYEIALP